VCVRGWTSGSCPTSPRPSSASTRKRCSPISKRFRSAGDAIAWAQPQWVEGDNLALRYRGHALKRGKIWLQRDDPQTHGFLKYFYTGWQWRVLPATACVDKCAPVKAVMDRYDAFCDASSALRANHAIVTRYRDGEHCIGSHFDKPKSIAPSTDALKSLITVVKIGQHGRPFTLAMRETPTQPFFHEVLPPGTAVIMTLEANLQTVHGVPAVAESGPSGSIVFRTITQRVPWAVAEREVTKRGGACAAIDPENLVEHTSAASAPDAAATAVAAAPSVAAAADATAAVQPAALVAARATSADEESTAPLGGSLTGLASAQDSSEDEARARLREERRLRGREERNLKWSGASFTHARDSEGFTPKIARVEKETCLVDGTWHAMLLDDAGCGASHARLLKLAIPDLGNARQATWDSMNDALQQTGLTQYRLEDDTARFSNQKPGVLFHLLNATGGIFLVRLLMRVDGKPPLFHIVCWSATHQKLIDNGGQRPLDVFAEDKAGPNAVVRAFRKLFDAHRMLKRLGAYSFDVTHVYELRRDGAPCLCRSRECTELTVEPSDVYELVATGAGVKRAAEASVGPAKAPRLGERVCAACGRALPTEAFSKTQRAKGPGGRCRECVERA